MSLRMRTPSTSSRGSATSKRLALTILAIIAVIGVPAFIGYKVGRAVERSRIRAEGRGDIAAASAGGGSDW